VNQVNSGSCAIFKIDEYTMDVRFEKRGNWDNNLKRFQDSPHRLHLNQLRGHGNKPAPKELEEVVNEAIEAFNLTLSDEKIKEYISEVNTHVVAEYLDNDLPF